MNAVNASPTYDAPADTGNTRVRHELQAPAPRAEKRTQSPA
jgi:hypothetical protein